MITKTELLRLVTQGVEGQPPADATVADFMSTEVVTVDPDALATGPITPVSERLAAMLHEQGRKGHFFAVLPDRRSKSGIQHKF